MLLVGRHGILTMMNKIKNQQEMKQTAVEYIIEQLYAPCRGIPSHIIEKAKEMEEKQTIKFVYSFLDNCFTKDGIIKKTAGEYYNETFKTNEK